MSYKYVVITFKNNKYSDNSRDKRCKDKLIILNLLLL